MRVRVVETVSGKHKDTGVDLRCLLHVGDEFIEVDNLAVHVDYKLGDFIGELLTGALGKVERFPKLLLGITPKWYLFELLAKEDDGLAREGKVSNH